MAVKRVVRQVVPGKPTTYRKPLPASLLYSNDFQSLVAFLNRRGEDVVAIGGKHAYIDGGDDLGDLQRKERTKLLLRTKAPEVLVRIGSTESYVETRALDSASAKRLVDDTVTLVSNWRTLSVRFSPLWVMPTLLFAAIVGTAAYLDPPKEDEGNPVVTGIVFAFIFLMTSGIAVLSSGNRVVVKPKTRGQSQDSRLKFLGNLTIGVLAGVAGAIATYFVALQDK